MIRDMDVDADDVKNVDDAYVDAAHADVSMRVQTDSQSSADRIRSRSSSSDGSPCPSSSSSSAVPPFFRNPNVLTFSPKVFIPVTRVCRDACGYCAFAHMPREGQRVYMSEEEVLAVAAAGAAVGCTEALFTLGDKPELKFSQAREELSAMGFASTLSYVEHLARVVMRETGLLPHVNAGVMGVADLAALRRVSASQGLMLESGSARLMQPGGPHHGCPDKDPTLRRRVLEDAGAAGVPFTTGLLVGIGETREDRLRDLLFIHQTNAESALRQQQQRLRREGSSVAAGTGSGGHNDDDAADVVSEPRAVEDRRSSTHTSCHIGDVREDSVESDPGAHVGHIQEVIVQPFRAKARHEMEEDAVAVLSGFVQPSVEEEELLWTVAMARVVLGPHANIQSPPNLSAGEEQQLRLIAAGISDWGGISPITPDWVNPEAPWPHVRELARVCSRAGKVLVPRLPVYPEYVHSIQRRATWLDETVAPHVLRHSDSQGYSRAQAWAPGLDVPLPARTPSRGQGTRVEGAGEGQREASGIVSVGSDGLLLLESSEYAHAVAAAGRQDQKSAGFSRRHVGPVQHVLAKLDAGESAGEADIVRLLSARGDELILVCRHADALRRRVNGDEVAYVVNRNINYTNMCTYGCKFCAFSKGRSDADSLRGSPYLLSMDEISRRVKEAWERGATEVCMQGGIHPEFTGETYLQMLRVAKSAAPQIHVHAFSPLEVFHGASTLDCTVQEYVKMLRAEGLGSLPGTAAEVLDDQVRAVLCPDKLTTQQWLEVVESAHSVGMPSTSTIMFGHIDSTYHWARHLLRLRALQQRTGSISEFVPLPFVHMQAPLYLRGGGARRGPTFHECVLMHAVARLVLHPVITNIQVSWVKMGPGGAQWLLQAGCNDMGGTLMNESITRAAGATHGQEMTPQEMERVIRAAGRTPKQRTTLYGTPPAEQVERSFAAPPLLLV